MILSALRNSLFFLLVTVKGFTSSYEALDRTVSPFDIASNKSSPSKLASFKNGESSGSRVKNYIADISSRLDKTLL